MSYLRHETEMEVNSGIRCASYTNWESGRIFMKLRQTAMCIWEKCTMARLLLATWTGRQINCRSLNMQERKRKKQHENEKRKNWLKYFYFENFSIIPITCWIAPFGACLHILMRVQHIQQCMHCCCSAARLHFVDKTLFIFVQLLSFSAAK